MKLLKNVTWAAHLIYFMTRIYFIKSPNFNSKSKAKIKGQSSIWGTHLKHCVILAI